MLFNIIVVRGKFNKKKLSWVTIFKILLWPKNESKESIKRVREIKNKF